MKALLSTIIDLQTLGVEFKVPIISVVDHKFNYNVTIPKKVSITKEDGTKFEKTFSEMKEYIKEKLVDAISEEYLNNQKLNPDDLSGAAKITASIWSQSKYDEYLEELKKELSEFKEEN